MQEEEAFRVASGEFHATAEEAIPACIDRSSRARRAPTMKSYTPALLSRSYRVLNRAGAGRHEVVQAPPPGGPGIRALGLLLPSVLGLGGFRV